MAADHAMLHCAPVLCNTSMRPAAGVVMGHVTKACDRPVHVGWSRSSQHKQQHSACRQSSSSTPNTLAAPKQARCTCSAGMLIAPTTTTSQSGVESTTIQYT
jgi:hypothetical protein